MKTYKELFEKHSDHWMIKNDGTIQTKTITIEDFDAALTEDRQQRDKEIKKTIDAMIEQDRELNKIFDTDDYDMAKRHNRPIETKVTIVLEKLRSKL